MAYKEYIKITTDLYCQQHGPQEDDEIQLTYTFIIQ